MNTILMLFSLAVSDPSFAGDTAIALNNQAVQLYGQSRYADAEKLYRKAMEIPAAHGTEAERSHAIAAGNLGTLLRVTGRYREAAEVLSVSLTEMESNPAVVPLEMLHTLENLAGTQQASGDPATADAIAKKAVALCDSHPEIPARDRAGLRLLVAGIHVDRRRYDEAEAEIHQVLATADDRQALIAYNSLTAIALQRGVPAEAERFARLALECAQRAFPKNNPSIAMVLNNLAQAYRFQEKYLEAEDYYRQAIAQWETGLGPSHPALAKGLTNLAAFYHERGREAGAEALYQRAETIFERTLGADSPLALVARNERADVLRSERRYAESERVGLESLEALEKHFAADDPRVMQALGNRARLLAETKRSAEAARVLDRLRRMSPAAFR